VSARRLAVYLIGLQHRHTPIRRPAIRPCIVFNSCHLTHTILFHCLHYWFQMRPTTSQSRQDATTRSVTQLSMHIRWPGVDLTPCGVNCAAIATRSSRSVGWTTGRWCYRARSARLPQAVITASWVRPTKSMQRHHQTVCLCMKHDTPTIHSHTHAHTPLTNQPPSTLLQILPRRIDVLRK